MTAITKSWTTIADAAVDPDSPLTTSLITALRDNDIYLREWLGASYTAGAVQDHSHDGVDSALVDTGGNALRNGSFETGLAAWTFADYSGGSHAISTSAHRHGAQSITFTSTVLANGGGEAVATGYTAVAEAEDYPWKFWAWASVANVSSKVQLIWYDNAKSSISTTDIYTSTNTPTSATLQRGATTAPANARWVRLKLIGGVPASGSATGTVRFDGVVLGDTIAVNGSHILAGSITGANIAAGVIAQGHLKTAYGSVSGGGNMTLPGGLYGFHVRTWHSGGTTFQAHHAIIASNTSAVANIYMAPDAGGNVFADQQYVQASPPYNLGNGDIPLFLFAALDAAGAVLNTYVAPDPPWANNGPTDIRADYYLAGRAYRRTRVVAAARALLRGTPAERATFLAALRDAQIVDIEICQARKQADMPLIPHPFLGALTNVAQVVLLDPVGARAEQLLALHEQSESLSELLHAGYIKVNNTPLTAAAPPGVAPVRWGWKNNGGST